MLLDKTIIDTHFHIWDASVLTLPTLDLFVGQLKRQYRYEDYQKAIQGINIIASYYVEVDTIKAQHQQEADMIVNLCQDDSNQIMGATIAGDLADPAFKDYILPYVKQKVVKSVRHNLFAAEARITETSIFRNNVDLLAELGLMCDLVMPVDKINYGVELVKACPNTTFVIDHCGVCPILADPETKAHWQQAITAYAQQSNTICKVSECGFTNPDYCWQVPDVTDIIRHCLHSFGEDRIIYGTNWPVCEITGNIARWLEALVSTLEEFPAQYSDKLFRINAERYYQRP